MSLCRTMLLVGLIALGPLVLGGDAPTPQMSTRNFEVRELDTKGNVAWTMVGKQAVVAGTRVNFTELDGKIFQEDGTYVVTTPKGTLNRETQRIASRAPIKVVREGMSLTGVGYDLDLANHKLVIRSKVKIIVNNRSLEELGKTQDEE